MLPTPDELAAAPELAILASLENTIDVAIVALVAANGDLQRRDDGRDVLTTLAGTAADQVIARAQHLAAAIVAYGDVVRGDLQPSR
jgi:hypothetical protein